MLELFPKKEWNCAGVSRRSALRIGTLTGLGLTLPTWLAARASSAQSAAPKDRNCILIWTRGGTSHHDTFDPKPEAPTSIKGEFGVIDTAIPGVRFTEIVPNMARHADKFGLLRSWNPRNGSHGTADRYVMSGHKFNAAVHHPTYGSVVSWDK